LKNGFDAKTARRYRDLSNEKIADLIINRKPAPIDLLKQAASKKAVGYEQKNTFFAKYNYIVKFTRKDGTVGHWTVISDTQLLSREVLEKAKIIYDRAYVEGQPSAYDHQRDSSARLSPPIMSSLKIIKRYKSNKRVELKKQIKKTGKNK
jgi:hypothetical protein